MPITAGVGLISGIPIEDTVNQLIALEAQPMVRLQSQVTTLNDQKSGLLELSARLLTMKLSTITLDSSDAFAQRSATSSSDSILTATAQRGTPLGTYSFSVKQLVQTQQLVSNGFADTDSTPVGAGTIRIEAGGFVDAATPLESLNGLAGVERGSIRITDRSGASATLDLSGAVTVQDVLDAINFNDDIDVTARASGDHLVLEDNTGQTTASLEVEDLSGRTMAADLGILATAAGNTLTGTSVLALHGTMLLDSLNGGTGVRGLTDTLADLRFQLRDGTQFDVTLEGDSTLTDVLDSINTHGSNGGKLTASLSSSGGSLTLTDNTSGGSTFQVLDPNANGAASDLGILKTDGDADGVIVGDRVLAGLNTVSLASVSGGTGIGTLGSISITDRSGAVDTVDLSAAQDLTDVIDAINNASVSVTARVSTARNGIELVDTSGGTAGNFIVADVGGSTVAADLGLTHNAADTTAASGDLDVNWINRGTRLAVLNGGRGVFAGKFRITTQSGAATDVDLSQGNEVTLADVISEINSKGIGVTARINDTGDGLLLEDSTSGSLTFKVTEIDGTTAADLNILGQDDDADGIIDGSLEWTLVVGATDTLDDVRQALNDLGAPVRAHIISDGSSVAPNRLTIASEDSGLAGQFLVDPGSTGLGFSTLSRARDAAIVFGDSAPGSQTMFVTSSTNTIANVVPGLTLDLKNTSTSTVSVSVAQDVEAVVSAVNTFVTNFNALRDRMDELTSFNPDTLEKGLLFGDPTVRRIESAMFNTVTRIVAATQTDQLHMITELGVRLGQSGKLTFDETKLRDAMANDMDKVEAFFATEDTGFAALVETAVDSLTDAPDGVITTASEHIDTKVGQTEDRIEDMTKSLAAKRQRLLNKFYAMESALAQLQTQQSFLSNIQAVRPTTSSSGGS